MTAVAVPEDDAEAVVISPEVLRERFSAIIGGLEREATDRVSKRLGIEQRWLTDMRQINGVYDPEIAKVLAETKKSAIYINQTRSKTNIMAARIGDLLFPTDDKNWNIGPTPVPELSASAEKASAEAITAKQAAEDAQKQSAPDAQALAESADRLGQTAEQYKSQLEEAKRRADRMSAEIDDQLTECRYSTMMRDVIEDGCRLGTGVAKGPVVGGRAKMQWSKSGPAGQQATADPQGGAPWALQSVADPAPRYYRVDPWHWFPDMDVESVDASESFFERHLFKPKDLRRLARTPGFDANSIRRLLRSGAKESAPQYLQELWTLNNETQSLAGNYFQVWEYNGALTAEELETIGLFTGNKDILSDLPDEVDPLEELQVVIWFCGTEILKIGPGMLDSGDPLYSVFNIEKSPGSIFGLGIPAMMRDSQRALSAAWRMMMDNSGLSTGPMLDVAASFIEPADGKWEITPRKIWKRKEGTAQDLQFPAIRPINIDSHQAELANIIEIALRFIDDETLMPKIAQGEQGSTPTNTVGGLSILMNAANVVFRRIIKNFDDDMTVPNIRRIYDWNMQFSAKDEIKGDYQVDARGSSVLLVREMQAQNLMALLLQFGNHPVYGIMLQHPAAFRRLIQSLMLPSDEIVKSDAEIKQIISANSEDKADPVVALKEMEIQANVEIANLEASSRVQAAKLNYDATMARLAADMNSSVDELAAKAQMMREKTASDERKLAVETAVTNQIGPTGGGTF